MYTSLMVVALVGSADVKALTWQTDYSAAQKRALEQKKPLAVVIGRGASGWEAVSRDGKIDAATAEALQTHYVCVYIDATTERGEKLADAFEMKSGLVLSDRSGDKQAFRHTGTLSNGDLESVVKRYSDPERVVTRTETHGQPEIRYYPSEATPTSGGAPYYFAPSGGSSCPSCGRR